MKNWTTRRSVTFWVHLLYVLIPTGAALVAAVNLWSWVFGAWYYSLPLIASLEVVAAIGYAFKLLRIPSPFVRARHFIPFFSVATLAYELGRWLIGMHGIEIGIGFTAFIVGVFGFLFVRSFSVLEHLVIDPVTAAEEKAREQAEGILVPVAEHAARATVYREFTEKLRAAEALPGPVGLSYGSGYSSQALLEETGDLREQLAVANARLESAHEELTEKGRLLAERYRIGEEQMTADGLTILPGSFGAGPNPNACTSCGGPVTNSDKGIAKRGGKALLCKDCRQGKV